mgnify:CR=1 FL=1
MTDRQNEDFKANLEALIALCNKANLNANTWTLQEATTVGTILSTFNKLIIK